MSLGPLTSCQTCGNRDLKSVIFLGYLPPVNILRKIGSPHGGEPWFPAEMLHCSKCHLIQLGFAADPNILFPPEYPYTSGTTRVLRENFADLYRESKEMIGLKPEDLVVDIGSNDGTLLKNFADGGHRVLGVEPSLTAKLAEEKGVKTMMAFFGTKATDEILKREGQATLVTAANVFAHIPDVNGVVENIIRLIGDDGVFINESHYAADLIHTVQYDTIYHEHLRYYSVLSLKYLLESHGLTVFHVRRIPSHGGSVRMYASKSSAFPVRDSVQKMIAEERALGLGDGGWIAPFRGKILLSKLHLYGILSKLRGDGARIFGIGAPSRASTLVNYVGIDDGIMEAVMEVKGSKKIGMYMPGRNIPILDEAKLYDEQPPYALLLSWHIGPELMKNLKKRGYRGDFLIPLPTPSIIPNGSVS